MAERRNNQEYIKEREKRVNAAMKEALPYQVIYGESI